MCDRYANLTDYTLQTFHYARLGEKANTAKMLRRTVGAGYSYVEAFRTDPILIRCGGTPEFEELMKELDEGK